MVNIKHIAAVIFFISLAASGASQNYSSSDTTTEYPNKGTFYHDMFIGRRTSSGELFDQNRFTAAHHKIKLGTFILVTNQNTGLQVIVKVNDRCPKLGVLDMTHRAATAIGIRGCQPVTVRILPEDEKYLQQWMEQLDKFDTIGVKDRYRDAHHFAEEKGDYNVYLGQASTFSEAYNLILKLPKLYRNMVDITKSADGKTVEMNLTYGLTQESAERLLEAISEVLPDAKTTNPE